jgi:hypothetical protein
MAAAWLLRLPAPWDRHTQGWSFVEAKLGCGPSSLWQNNRAFSYSLALSHPDLLATIEALSHCPHPHASGLPPATGADSDSGRHHPAPRGEIPWRRSSARRPAPPPRNCPAARHRRWWILPPRLVNLAPPIFGCKLRLWSHAHRVQRKAKQISRGSSTPYLIHELLSPGEESIRSQNHVMYIQSKHTQEHHDDHHPLRFVSRIQGRP